MQLHFMATIFIIDDEKGCRDLLERRLDALGFIAVAAASGDQGVEFSKTIKPDLILLGWNLNEGISGEETLRLFQTQRQTKDVPIVVLSGIDWSSAHESRVAQISGAAKCIAKDEISNFLNDRAAFERCLQAAGQTRASPRQKEFKGCERNGLDVMPG
jgi:CheY-like chemotaxis protein